MNTAAIPAVADFILAQANNDDRAIVFEDQQWTYREYVAECKRWGNFFLSQRQDGPFHIGILLDNIPAFVFAMGGASLVGATLVGINPTRRGAELTRDIQFTDCQILVSESNKRDLLDDVDTGLMPERIHDVDSTDFKTMLSACNAELDTPPPGPDALFMLIFTSGTTGAPKAVQMNQGRVAAWGSNIALAQAFTHNDVAYCPMPLFHSNALVTCWCPSLVAGATLVLPRKFSASRLLADMHKHQVTYFNYVGKALAYLLAVPETREDANNALTRVFGNEAAEADIARFAERFDCRVTDGFGSTEGGVSISRTPDTPKGALGLPTSGRVEIVNADTGEQCPVAHFDNNNRLLNASDAIGEIVNVEAEGSFQGYYKNPEANARRMQGKAYYSGDLGYKDEQGFIYFAGRDSDWLRVDGENFSSAPVERILGRYDAINMAAVYAVPDVQTGDQVMVALVVNDSERFNIADFQEFLGRQTDMGSKWLPRFVRIMEQLPDTASLKTVRRKLGAQHWECEDAVWWRPDNREADFVAMRMTDKEALRTEFTARHREALLDR